MGVAGDDARAAVRAAVGLNKKARALSDRARGHCARPVTYSAAPPLGQFLSLFSARRRGLQQRREVTP